MTLDSVEQIYASIPGGDKFRVNAEDSTGYGIVWAGDSGNDTVDLTTGTLTFSNHTGQNFDLTLATNTNNILGTILFGADGNDAITGVAAKENQIYGGTGTDTLTGGSGSDTLDGGSGDDSLSGAAGNDALYGLGGNDTLNGGGGNDSLTGGTGNDSLYGGAGNDTLQGEAGADSLQGGAGVDILSGGAGADRFIFSGESASGLGTVIISDFSGATAFSGSSGEGDDFILDTSDLGINAITYEEVSWDGTAGTLANAAAAIAVSDATATNGVFIFNDSANGTADTLSMVHTDNLNGDGTDNWLATLLSVTNTGAAANMSAADFDVIA